MLFESHAINPVQKFPPGVGHQSPRARGQLGLASWTPLRLLGGAGALCRGAGECALRGRCGQSGNRVSCERAGQEASWTGSPKRAVFSCFDEARVVKFWMDMLPRVEKK